MSVRMKQRQREQPQSYLERLAQMVAPVSEAAGALGVSRQRVLQLIRQGDLEAVKIGNDWFVSALSVQERRNGQERRERRTPVSPSKK